MEIRLFQPQDVPQIAQLFHDTVRSINLGDYTLEQVQTWAPDDIYFRDWEQICAKRFTYVAVTHRKTSVEEIPLATPPSNQIITRTNPPNQTKEIILGFGELEVNGHIDCFYCHRDYQRCGVGNGLFRAIELKAEELGIDRLCVEASITALPFFQRQGFTIIQAQEVTVRGCSFRNYSMEKSMKKSMKKVLGK